jgi:hypothetical protein
MRLRCLTVPACAVLRLAPLALAAGGTSGPGYEGAGGSIEEKS